MEVISGLFAPPSPSMDNGREAAMQLSSVSDKVVRWSVSQSVSQSVSRLLFSAREKTDRAIIFEKKNFFWFCWYCVVCWSRGLGHGIPVELRGVPGGQERLAFMESTLALWTPVFHALRVSEILQSRAENP